MSFKSRLSVTVVTLSLGSLVLSFQNCAPQNFDELQASSEIVVPHEFALPGGSDAPVGGDTVSNSGGTTSQNQSTPASGSSSSSGGNAPNTSSSSANSGGKTLTTSNSSPNSISSSNSTTQTVAEPGPLVMIGGCEGQIALTANSNSSGIITFPYVSLSGGRVCGTDGLYIFIYDAVSGKPASASFQWCISDANYGCSSDSEFKNGRGPASILVNYWKTETNLKHFDTFYITVKIQGVTKKAKYLNRAYLNMPAGKGPGSGFYSSTAGVNNFGFSCAKGSYPSSQGWITYPYGSLSNDPYHRNNPCYYRILTDSELDALGISHL